MTSCWKWQVLVLSHATTNVPDSELMVPVRFETGTPPQNVAFWMQLHERFSHDQVFKVAVPELVVVLDIVWVHGPAEQKNCSTPA